MLKCRVFDQDASDPMLLFHCPFQTKERKKREIRQKIIKLVNTENAQVPAIIKLETGLSCQLVT